MSRARRIRLIIVLLSALSLPATVLAHGSVTPESDLCVIQIGYYKAHFKIYQPERRGLRDYCEDLPSGGRSVFIMEYEHAGLGSVPIDFRIIRNVTGNGRFANQDDVARLGDLDAVTVFHHAPAVQPDVFMVEHEFADTGSYIGVITIRNPDTGKVYNAVFPFEVGYWGLGYWPLIVLAALVLQLHYLWMNGWFRRFRRKADLRLVVPMLGGVVIAALMSAAAPVSAEDARSWRSRSGHFEVSYQADHEPLAINRIHSWVLTVRDETGKPVTGATISVSGGMPLHDHGLPTDPRMTSELGDGRYLVEGMRFHMHGEWIVDIKLDKDGMSDVASITLTL